MQTSYIYKLKMLSGLGEGWGWGRDLNIINQSMGGTTKKGGTKFLKFNGRKQKRWITIFDLNLVRGKTLEEIMLLKTSKNISADKRQHNYSEY